MTLEEYVAKHRTELRNAVLARVPNARYLDDDELENWVLNDEGLYLEAKREGVEEI